MSRFWGEYVRKRFIAQKNLVQVLRYQGLQIEGWYDPQNVQEFRTSWREKLNPGDRTGVLEMDANPQTILHPNGKLIVIMFIPSNLGKLSIPKATLRPFLLKFLAETKGITEEEAFSQVELIKGIEAIYVSYTPLDGTAKNEIARFNSILENPIRHFTVDELQFDPTVHITTAKSMRALSIPEIQALIDRQKGLIIGNRNRLIPNFAGRLEEMQDENERHEFIAATNEEILRKLPTMNSSDPWVKWRGFKAGDVVEIHRRASRTPITYRRIILVEQVTIKKSKVKVATTNK